MKTEDTYAVLEFQGFVVDSPRYDKETKTLWLKAKPASQTLAPLSFKADGTIAKAFKSLLHTGCLVQIQAIPLPRYADINGSMSIIIDWKATRIQLLGKQRVNLGSFADVRILDGLIPDEDEIIDIGYVDPITFGRFQERLDKARNEIRRKNEDDD